MPGTDLLCYIDPHKETRGRPKGPPIDPQKYQDGDIILSFNQREIHRCHAEMICHRSKWGFTSTGHRPRNTPAEDWYRHTHPHMLKRVSRTQAVIVDLDTMFETLVPPAGTRGGMDVEWYFQNRLRSVRHDVFGTPEREYRYGRVDKFYKLDDVAIGRVWNDIETKTPHNRWGTRNERDDRGRTFELRHDWWPAGRDELAHHAFVRIENISDEQMRTINTPDRSLSPRANPQANPPVPNRELILHQKRRFFINLDDLMSPSERNKMRDPSVHWDGREVLTSLSFASIANERPARGTL